MTSNSCISQSCSGYIACTLLAQCVPGGQLLKMDAGCEVHGYCSDVTRTWPVNGRFSSPQRDVYEIVRETHDA
jgi:Xaa-Pro aminopeptidase